MPTREQIIEDFTNRIKEFKKYARNIAGIDDADDLFQECSLMLLEFDEPRLQSYWNNVEGLKPFFLRMLSLQYKSKTSKFHKTYRKEEMFIQTKGADVVYNELLSCSEETDVDLPEMCKLIDSISDNELEQMIWKIYVDKGSLRKTLEAIPEQYIDLFDLKRVHVIVKKFQRMIKRRLDDAV